MLVAIPFFILLFVIAVVDLLTKKIPNYLVLFGLFYALGVAFYSVGPVSFIYSIFGFMLGLIIFSIPYVKGLIGAGDVKLASLSGSFLGPFLLLDSILYASIIGGGITVIYLIYKGVLHRSISDLLRLEGGVRIPYGYAISLGTFLSYFKPNLL